MVLDYRKLWNIVTIWTANIVTIWSATYQNGYERFMNTCERENQDSLNCYTCAWSHCRRTMVLGKIKYRHLNKHGSTWIKVRRIYLLTWMRHNRPIMNSAESRTINRFSRKMTDGSLPPQTLLSTQNFEHKNVHISIRLGITLGGCCNIGCEGYYTRLDSDPTRQIPTVTQKGFATWGRF
jgi:hypothetical protein